MSIRSLYLVLTISSNIRSFILMKISERSSKIYLRVKVELTVRR